MASLSIKIHSSEEVEYEGGNVHPPKATIAFQLAPNQILPTDLGCDEPSEGPNIIALTNKLKTVPVVPAKGTTTAEKPPAPRGRAGSSRFMPYLRQKPTADRQVPVPNAKKGHQMTDMLKPFAGLTGIATAKISVSSGPAGRLPFGIKPNLSKKPTQETPKVKKPPLADDDMVYRVADLFGLFPAEVYPGIPKMRVSMPYLLTIYCTALQKLKDSVAGPELSIWKNEKAFKFPPIPELQAKAPGTATPNTSKCPVVPELKHFTVPGVPTPTTLKVPKIPNLKHFIDPAVRRNKPFTGMPAEEIFRVPSTPRTKGSTAPAMSARKQESVTDMFVEERFKFPAVATNKLRTVPVIPTWKPKPVTGMPVGAHFKVPAAPANKLRTAPAMPAMQPKPFRGKLLREHFKVPASRRNKLSLGPAMPANKSASAPVGVKTKNQDQVGEFRGFKRQIRGLQYKLHYIQKRLRNQPLSK